MTKKKQHVVQSPFGPIPIIKLSHAYTAKQIQAALKKKVKKVPAGGTGTFSAVKAAKEFAATYAVTLSDRQHKVYVEALARAFVHAFNKGYTTAQQDVKRKPL